MIYGVNKDLISGGKLRLQRGSMRREVNQFSDITEIKPYRVEDWEREHWGHDDFRFIPARIYDFVMSRQPLEWWNRTQTTHVYTEARLRAEESLAEMGHGPGAPAAIFFDNMCPKQVAEEIVNLVWMEVKVKASEETTEIINEVFEVVIS